MQPYFFPYIGYFQLIHSTDKFIFYDDVSFIKQGWIARNRILMNGEAMYFSVPLEQQSSFTAICDTKIHQDQFKKWKKKFLKTLYQSYCKAPFFKEIELLVEKVIEKEYQNISELSICSILEICRYIGITRKFDVSSEKRIAADLHNKERVLAICRKEKASHYINLPGGESLYERSFFKAEGIELQFIQTGEISYNQHSQSFVPYLSAIDILMFNSKEQVLKFIGAYTLK